MKLFYGWTIQPISEGSRTGISTAALITWLWPGSRRGAESEPGP